MVQNFFFLLLGLSNNVGCQKAALGMESGVIVDEQITASSDLYGFPPEHGRLQGDGYWGATGDINQWLQIDLGNPNTSVTGVATQGYGPKDWVTTYKLQYSNNGVNFTYYKEQGQTADRVGRPINNGKTARVSNSVCNHISKNIGIGTNHRTHASCY